MSFFIADHDHHVLIVENELNLSNLEVDGLTVGSLLNQPGVRGEGLPVHHGGDGDDDCEAADGEDVFGV